MTDWTIDTALDQVLHGDPSPATDSASSYLEAIAGGTDTTALRELAWGLLRAVQGA